MKKVIFASILLIGLFITCTADKAEGITINSSISFEVPPIEQISLEEVKKTLKKTTSERDEDGFFKKENFPILISQILGLLHNNPSDNTIQMLCFEVAEVLQLGRDYENATKLFLTISQTFPKSDIVGNALFQLAYTQEKNMDDKKTAMINYTYFLRNYPNHPYNGVASKRLEALTKVN